MTLDQEVLHLVIVDLKEGYLISFTTLLEDLLLENPPHHLHLELKDQLHLH